MHKRSNDTQHNIIMYSPENVGRIFYQIVHDTGPDDIVKSVQVYDEVGEEKIVRITISKPKKDLYKFKIALNRDLTESEAELIVFALEANIESDFFIQTSTPYTASEPTSNTNNATTEFPKNNNDLIDYHTRWLREMAEDGWRYNQKYSRKEKTHPMMLPWEQLPKSYKSNYSGILQGILDRS